MRPGRDVEGDEDVNGVMFVRRENEEDSEDVAYPSEGMQEVNLSRRVLRNEEV